MKPNLRFLSFAVALVVILIAALIFFTRTPTTPENRLTRVFDDSPTGFTFRYPDDWDYTIPAPGLLIAGLAQTIQQGEAGPTFTVQRANPLSIYETLDAALDQYLRRGPLSEDWQQTGEITPGTFQGRESLTVAIERPEDETSPAQRGEILVTTAENTLVYFIVLTAPTSVWDTFEPILRAMLNTVMILE
jgi:hypothetical protein